MPLLGKWAPEAERFMVRTCLKWLILAGFLSGLSASAQTACTSGIRVEGTITDPTGAVIPGARVQAASGESIVADASGHYVLPCVSSIPARITAQFPGFTSETSVAVGLRGATVRLDLKLPIEMVRTSVHVNADAPGIDTESAASDLTAADLARLPDDPDDLLRELQTLAAAAGGDPSATTVVVDGFQNGSAMPPKSAIASVRVNPDLFWMGLCRVFSSSRSSRMRSSMVSHRELQAAW
jgi:hypothetical protein